VVAADPVSKKKQLEMLRNIEVQRALQGVMPDEKKKPTAHELHMQELRQGIDKLKGNLRTQKRFISSLRDQLETPVMKEIKHRIIKTPVPKRRAITDEALQLRVSNCSFNNS